MISNSKYCFNSKENLDAARYDNLLKRIEEELVDGSQEEKEFSLDKKRNIKTIESTLLGNILHIKIPYCILEDETMIKCIKSFVPSL